MPSSGGAQGDPGVHVPVGGLPRPVQALAGQAFAMVTRILDSLRRNGMDKDIRRGRKFAARLLRVLVLAVMSFRANQIPVRASALTYTAILSVIPFVVILSAVAGRFGYLDLLSRLVATLVSSFNLDLNLDPVLEIIGYAQRVDFGQMGVIGSLGLLFTFFLAMANIEVAVDHIWAIQKERSWWRRLKEYTPFLVILVGGVLAAGNFLLEYRNYLTPRIYGDARSVLVHDTLFLLSTAGMLSLAWGVLFLLNFLIPYTRVRVFPAALGATLSTLGLYGLWRVVVEFPALFISRTSYIWGSLAAVPLVLLVIYLSWVVVLYGSAVAFIYQRLYRSEGKAEDAAEAAAPFHRVEREVLDVLRAVSELSGSPDIHGRKAVPLDVLARKVDRQEAYTESLAAPLVDLGYLTKRQVRSGPVYAMRIPLAEVDLSAVHSLLLRLDPEGKGRLRALNALDELNHTLGSLYSRSHLDPPLYLSAVLGDRSAPQTRP